MNIDIRENVINKIKEDSKEDIINMINESVETKEELVLPGLGVIIELFWNELNNEEKEHIGKLIKTNLERH